MTKCINETANRKLMQARKHEQEAPPVLNWDVVGGNAVLQKMAAILQLLQKEELERECQKTLEDQEAQWLADEQARQEREKQVENERLERERIEAEERKKVEELNKKQAQEEAK